MAEIRSLVHKHGIEAVAVDYLQLLTFSSKKSTTDAIGEATKGFKNLAKELEVPILLLSQLNRKNEDRSDKEPQLSDLRASGDIEQDADTVLMLHRPEYYKIEAFMDSGESTKGIAQVLIRKGRQSGTGEVRLNWQETNTVFYGQGETSSVYYQPGGESEIPF
jgi:replicative DNA helicase